nr:flavodoxin [uncultured Anaeromusa sp.]
MKKMVTLVLALLVLAVSLAGCSNSNANKQASLSSVEKNQTPLPSTEVSPTTKEGKKALVVYFSLPETTKPDNMTKEEANSTVIVDGKVLGNTQYVAYLIQANTGADIFRIEPKTPYPTDHKTLVALAKEEQKNKTRPELAARIENLDQYKVIFLGYPNWWGDMPMVVYSFLESHDLSGKTIIPFNTHGGSGFSNTINTLAVVQPKAAIVKNGFSVSRDTVQNCAADVASWVKELQY